MGGLQFRDVRVQQSDLEFVDYHRRSTRGLIKRPRVYVLRRASKILRPELKEMPEIGAKLCALKRKL